MMATAKKTQTFANDWKIIRHLDSWTFEIEEENRLTDAMRAISLDFDGEVWRLDELLLKNRLNLYWIWGPIDVRHRLRLDRLLAISFASSAWAVDIS